MTPSPQPRQPYINWGRKMRAARQALQMSQRRLAEICELDVTTISRFERGVFGPRDRVKYLLAGALCRSVDELFPYPTERPPFPEHEHEREQVAS